MVTISSKTLLSKLSITLLGDSKISSRYTQSAEIVFNTKSKSEVNPESTIGGLEKSIGMRVLLGRLKIIF
jgi:hypothetical protein